MRTNPKISVIMGIYNCASTLRESIESILNQTYKDFEFIMCDDGSEDETYRIADEYARKYDNIIVLRNEKNLGLNATLNKCLKFAKGEYIARQDGDDLSFENRFEEEVYILDNNPSIALVSTSMVYFDEEGEFKISSMKEWPSPKDFVYGSPFCHAPCMLRTSVIRSVGGYSEGNNLLRVEDYHLWFKIYSKGYRGYNLQKTLYKMRDDRNAYKRRKYRYRINEAYVRYIGFRMLKLPYRFYPYILRPLIVGLLPYSIYKRLHR